MRSLFEFLAQKLFTNYQEVTSLQFNQFLGLIRNSISATIKYVDQFSSFTEKKLIGSFREAYLLFFIGKRHVCVCEVKSQE